MPRIRPYSILHRVLTPIRETDNYNTISLNMTEPTPPPRIPPREIFESLRIPDAVKDLPQFEGNPRLLHDFLNNVEEILCVLNDFSTSPFAKIILRAIRNKVVGPANEALNMYGTPLDWNSIKNNLITHYSDKRSETSLIKDLHDLRQNEQSLEKFYGSVIEIQATINNNLYIHETDVNVITSKKILI